MIKKTDSLLFDSLDGCLQNQMKLFYSAIINFKDDFSKILNFCSELRVSQTVFLNQVSLELNRLNHDKLSDFIHEYHQTNDFIMSTISNYLIILIEEQGKTFSEKQQNQNKKHLEIQKRLSEFLSFSQKEITFNPDLLINDDIDKNDRFSIKKQNDKKLNKKSKNIGFQKENIKPQKEAYFYSEIIQESKNEQNAKRTTIAEKLVNNWNKNEYGYTEAISKLKDPQILLEVSRLVSNSILADYLKGKKLLEKLPQFEGLLRLRDIEKPTLILDSIRLNISNFFQKLKNTPAVSDRMENDRAFEEFKLKIMKKVEEQMYKILKESISKKKDEKDKNQDLEKKLINLNNTFREKGCSDENINLNYMESINFDLIDEIPRLQKEIMNLENKLKEKMLEKGDFDKCQNSLTLEENALKSKQLIDDINFGPNSLRVKNKQLEKELIETKIKLEKVNANLNIAEKNCENALSSFQGVLDFIEEMEKEFINLTEMSIQFLPREKLRKMSEITGKDFNPKNLLKIKKEFEKTKIHCKYIISQLKTIALLKSNEEIDEMDFIEFKNENELLEKIYQIEKQFEKEWEEDGGKQMSSWVKALESSNSKEFKGSRSMLFQQKNDENMKNKKNLTLFSGTKKNNNNSRLCFEFVDNFNWLLQKKMTIGSLNAIENGTYYYEGVLKEKIRLKSIKAINQKDNINEVNKQGSANRLNLQLSRNDSNNLKKMEKNTKKLTNNISMLKNNNSSKINSKKQKKHLLTISSNYLIKAVKNNQKVNTIIKYEEIIEKLKNCGNIKKGDILKKRSSSMPTFSQQILLNEKSNEEIKNKKIRNFNQFYGKKTCNKGTFAEKLLKSSYKIIDFNIFVNKNFDEKSVDSKNKRGFNKNNQIWSKSKKKNEKQDFSDVELNFPNIMKNEEFEKNYLNIFESLKINKIVKKGKNMEFDRDQSRMHLVLPSMKGSNKNGSKINLSSDINASNTSKIVTNTFRAFHFTSKFVHNLLLKDKVAIQGRRL